jgi:hypothetical protein
MQKGKNIKALLVTYFPLDNTEITLLGENLQQLTGLGLGDGRGAPQAPRLQTFLKLKLTLPH